jgi:hypothetical protein
VASYRFYNLKVLPLSRKRSELIGREGYIKLFEQLQRKIRSSFQRKDIASISYPLRNDFFYTVFVVKPEVPYAHGKFLKFDQPGALMDTLTGEVLQSIPKNASAHRYEVRFVFDYTRHVLAVQQSSGRLNPATLMDALTFLFEPIVSEYFPNHYLEIDLLKSQEAIDEVIKAAESFRKADVHVSATNTDEYLDDEIEETQEEMREMNIGEIHHVESAPKDDVMVGLSKRIQAYIKMAKKNGNATLTYFSAGSARLRKFVLRNHPLQLKVPLTRRMREGEYLDAIHTALIDADNKSKA